MQCGYSNRSQQGVAEEVEKTLHPQTLQRLAEPHKCDPHGSTECLCGLLRHTDHTLLVKRTSLCQYSWSLRHRDVAVTIRVVPTPKDNVSCMQGNPLVSAHQMEGLTSPSALQREGGCKNCRVITFGLEQQSWNGLSVCNISQRTSQMKQRKHVPAFPTRPPRCVDVFLLLQVQFDQPWVEDRQQG
jgi:hypothetical protein